MRLHRHLLIAVSQALHRIFAEGGAADQVIAYHLQNNRKWGARDRRFFAETTYDLVRWWRRLWFAWEREPALDEQELLVLVGIGLVVLDKVPTEALDFWVEWRHLDWQKLRDRYAHVDAPAVRASLPDWLMSVGEKELGEKWLEVIEASNQQAPVFIRANRLLTVRDQLRAELLRENFATDLADDRDALVLHQRQNLFQSQAFQKGLFEVQDLHSQRVAPFLQVEPGQRVIDACAGAGGKTLHLASLMGGRGRVLALDIHPHKLSELSRRARRARASSIETRVIDSTKVIKRLKASADRVLLDVPCSGVGVLRRNPDSKWKLSMDEIERLHQVQSTILHNYSSMVRCGGKLVYATCSVFPSENEKPLHRFIDENPEWQLEEECSFWPQPGRGDGFYMARLRLK